MKIDWTSALGTKEDPVLLGKPISHYDMAMRYAIRHAHYADKCVKNRYVPPSMCTVKVQEESEDD